jgi:hypothetical protein
MKNKHILLPQQIKIMTGNVINRTLSNQLFGISFKTLNCTDGPVNEVTDSIISVIMNDSQVATQCNLG